MATREGTRARRQAHVTLTPRQQEVLGLMSRGLTNGEIAQRLGVTLDGAKFHVAEILAKLEVGSREEAVEAWRAQQRRRWLPAGFGLSKIAVGTAAIAGAGVVAVVFAAILNSGGGDERDVFAAGEPTERATPGVTRAPPSPADAPGLLARCPSPVPATPTSGGLVDWVDFANFAGVHYLAARSVPAVEASKLGTPYGRVQVNVSEVIVDPWSSRADCEAAFLPVGETLYRIDGYDPRFRIATGAGKVYEAYSVRSPASGEDFLDLRGKVTRLDIQDQAGLKLAEVSEPAVIERLVDLLLAAPLDEVGDWFGPRVRLEFQLRDGTNWTTSLLPAGNVVGTGLRVAPEFTEAITEALAAGP